MRPQTLFLLTAFFLLGACSTSSMTTAAAVVGAFDPLDIFQAKVNMQEKNYAAADYLVGRATNFVKPGHAIRAMPLLEVEEPRLVTPFGKMVPEQIGERLIQLGYNVDLTAVSTGVAPEFTPAPEPSARKPGGGGRPAPRIVRRWSRRSWSRRPAA